MSAPSPPPLPQVRISDALSWAFDTLKKNASGFIALAAVVAVIQLAQQFAIAPLNAIVTDCTNPQSPGQENACSVAVQDGLATGGLLLAFFLILGMLATVGVYRAGVRASQGMRPSFAEMFTTENLGKYLLFTLAYVALSVAGTLACIAPGLAVLFFLQLGPFYVLDKGYGVKQAIVASFRATSRHFGPTVIMTLVNIVTLLIGGAFYGVLTLVTLPFSTLFTVHVYRQINGEAVR